MNACSTSLARRVCPGGRGHESTVRAWPVRCIAVLVGAGLASCGDDARIIGVPEEGAEATDAQYLVHLSIDAPDGRVNYFVPTGSLAEGTPVDLDRALEIPGTARLYAPPTGGYFAVGNTSDLTISRYDVAADGTLSLTGGFSMQNLGITNLRRTMAFIDERKAYYLDETDARAIAWDPEQLSITGEIDLGIAARPDMNLKFVRQNYPSRPGRLITTVTWASPERERLARETGLLVIDTERDEILSYEVDTRCTGASEIVEMPNGDIYFATGPDEVVGIAELRGSAERAGCMLRVKAGEERFDPDFLVNLSTLAGGRVACNIFPSGSENELFFRVLDETRAEWTLANDEVGGTEAWQWWRLSSTDLVAQPETTFGVETVYTNYTLVQGQVFVTRQTEGAAESQFYEVLPGGGMQPSLLAPGFLWAATRVR